MVAPYAVEEARRRGVGAKYRAKLGGVRDTRFSTPIELDVEVVNLFDARFTPHRPYWQKHADRYRPLRRASATAM